MQGASNLLKSIFLGRGKCVAEGHLKNAQKNKLV